MEKSEFVVAKSEERDFASVCHKELGRMRDRLLMMYRILDQAKQLPDSDWYALKDAVDDAQAAVLDAEAIAFDLVDD